MTLRILCGIIKWYIDCGKTAPIPRPCHTERVLAAVMKKALKEAVKLFAFKIVYPLTYKLFCLRRQQRGLTLFCEVRHGYLTDSYKPICEELKRRGKSYRVFYIHNNKGGLGYLLRYLKLCMILPTSGTILVDDTCNLFGAFKLRRGTKLIQTWHSCGAFKKWGYSIAGLSFGQEPKELDRYPAHTGYTLVTVSSGECVKHFDNAFGFDRMKMKSPVKATGVARTDYFFDKKNLEDAYRSLYSVCPEARGKRVLLYAPTYRGDADDAKPPEQFDIAAFMSGLDDCVLLIKQHSFVKERTEIPQDCGCYDVSERLPIEKLLIVSDLVITDYSSLIFEYSLFLRPMVFYAYDLDSFYDYRGFYYSYDNDFLPGEIVRTEEGLAPAVRRALDGGYDRDEIKRFRERFMGACDGSSAKRIVDYIIGKKERDL